MMRFYQNPETGEIVTEAAEGFAEIIPNTVDASKEKHVPVITREGSTVTVAVGAAAHPMLEAHYIGWILLETADGLVLASPVYYASANGTLVSLLDRLFYSTKADLTMKVAASVAVARRGGCSATFDELNKYFTISGMPVASSEYWNMVYGLKPGDAEQDAEGMRTVRVLAENMSFLMKSIALGKEKYGLPEREERVATNFIR